MPAIAVTNSLCHGGAPGRTYVQIAVCPELHLQLDSGIIIAKLHSNLTSRQEDYMGSQCTHINEIQSVTPSANGCEDCLKTGDSWVHLRLCMTCGHVGCCDSSKNKHATRHFHSTRHPVIKSFEPGEDWGFCYPDQLFFESI